VMKGTNYLSTEQNKTQLVSLLLDVLNIYKQKSQNSSVTANTNGVKLELSLCCQYVCLIKHFC
jgi:hypothetical protein